MTDFFLICSIKSPQSTDMYSDFPSPRFDVPNASNFTSGGVQKQDFGNDCDVISGLQALRETDFSVIFLL